MHFAEPATSVLCYGGIYPSLRKTRFRWLGGKVSHNGITIISHCSASYQQRARLEISNAGY